jgi:DinB superfamily
MNADQVLRQQLVNLLRVSQAHAPFEAIVADFPAARINDRAPNVSYSPWHLLEHIRLTQLDILDFIRDPNYVSRPWPAGYWPAPGTHADSAAWQRTIHDYLADRDALERIVLDPATDLCAPLPAGDKYTILREILVVADHTAYHVGEFGILRQVMGTWPPGHE